jgi:hypothetical protein
LRLREDLERILRNGRRAEQQRDCDELFDHIPNVKSFDEN